ncbi:MAG: hypothetical protein E7541_01215 [Ruminococcaceae bacterium]|nr:hypothetical protein [Oscillospiraceae bacterium]
MSKAKRVFCAAIAAVMLLVCATGCSAPKLYLGGTPDVAATINGVEMSTGEYLAYLYTTFTDLYYNQGLYQYDNAEAYGYDIWTQTYPYGEGDAAQQLELADYMIAATKDNIIRQTVLEAMLKENGLTWDAKEQEEVEKELKEQLTPDAFLELGISNEHFAKVYRATGLNDSSLFYGLYREGGKRAMSEADRRAYFDKNYLSFKIINVPMMSSDNQEYTEEEQKKVLNDLDKYLQNYNKDGNFEAVVDAYNKANAADGQEITASTDKDNRYNYDATQLGDDELVKAIRSVEVGKAKVVTYKSGGTNLTAALILRLDINKPANLFADETDNIIRGAKYEEFNKEVQEAMKKVTAEFDSSAIDKCDPKNFLTVAE